MQVPTRAIAALALLPLFVSCDRVAERKLVGTWRAEKDGTVDELAFHADHTVVWWMCPAELSTPQTFVSAGEWRVRHNRIDIDSKPLTSAGPPEHHSLHVLETNTDSLLLKDTKEGSTVRLHRLDAPTCVTPKTGAIASDIEQNIVGTWQVHYHTHEFKYHFTPDHRVAVSGLVSGEFQPLWKGSWSVSGSDLLMDLKPDSRGMGEQKPHWTLYGFQRDCFAIKDPEGISYAVHRVE